MAVMLGKKGVKSLLSTIEGRNTQSASPKVTRKPPPIIEIDTDAEPQSSEGEPEELSPAHNASPGKQPRPASSSRKISNLENVELESKSKSVTQRAAYNGSSPKPSLAARRSGGPPEPKKESRTDVNVVGKKRKGQSDGEDDFNSIFSNDIEPRRPRKKGTHLTYKRVKLGATRNLHTAAKKENAELEIRQKSQFKALPVDSNSPPSNGKTSFTAPKSPIRGSNRLRNGRAFATPPNSISSAGPSKRAFQKTDSNFSARDIGSEGDEGNASPAAEELNSTSHNELSATDFLDSLPALRDGSPSSIDVTRCPLCKAVVDSEFLEEHPNAKVLRLQAAMDFCAAHKQHSARKLWALSKYPTIEWDNLDVRLSNFDDQLRAILERRTASTFRQKLEEKVASGRSRNELRQVKGDVSQNAKWLYGYYGTKGARKMMEHITCALASELRTSSAEDVLFTEVGVPGFVQTVLVPELVQLLVMDDFGCNRKEAEDIIERSAEMGVLVNEEEEEQIAEESEANTDV